MAQLSSRKTLVRAGTVGGAAGFTHYLAHRAFGEETAFDRAGVMPAGIAVALATAGGVAFFETRDAN